MTTSDKLRAISRILKERFPNLTVDETLDLAGKILDALESES